MSVQLGQLVPKSDERSASAQPVEVSARSFDGDRMYLEQGTGDAPDCIELDRKQLQQLSVIIDRFLDR